MGFHWWWIPIALAAIWIAGWCAGVIAGVFFNPLDSEEDRRKDFRKRLLAQSVVNWLLWPWMLPALLERRKFLDDIKTGKKPSWIILAKDEQSAGQWTLSDGTKFVASVSDSGDSSADIVGDYEDDSLTGEVLYRVRMIAPQPGPPTDWARLTFIPRGPEPDPQDTDAVDDYLAERYETSVQLPHGKYAVEFRAANRSGQMEHCAGVILIVADPEDRDS